MRYLFEASEQQVYLIESISRNFTFLLKFALEVIIYKFVCVPGRYLIILFGAPCHYGLPPKLGLWWRAGAGLHLHEHARSFAEAPSGRRRRLWLRCLDRATASLALDAVSLPHLICRSAKGRKDSWFEVCAYWVTKTRSGHNLTSNCGLVYRTVHCWAVATSI